MIVDLFRRRHTLSRCASDKPVKDFARVAGRKRLSERARDERILELLNNPNPTGETIEELAKLMGQHAPPIRCRTLYSILRLGALYDLRNMADLCTTTIENETQPWPLPAGMPRRGLRSGDCSLRRRSSQRDPLAESS